MFFLTNTCWELCKYRHAEESYMFIVLKTQLAINPVKILGDWLNQGILIDLYDLVNNLLKV